MSQSGHGSVPARVLRQRATLPDISWPYVYAQTVGVSADGANIATGSVRVDLRDGSSLVLDELPKAVSGAGQREHRRVRLERQASCC